MADNEFEKLVSGLDRVAPRSKRVISAQDRRQAQEMIEFALNHNMRGDNEKAFEYLRKAFALNSDLRYDEYTVNLLATVRLRSPEQALEEVDQWLAKQQKIVNDAPKRWSAAFIIVIIVLAIIFSLLLALAISLALR